MPTVTLNSFTSHLVASGIYTEREIEAVVHALPAAERPADGPALSKLLVAKGMLTPYQADNILKGRVSGWVLGDYVILDSLTQGGMSMVYKAQHRRMKRIVVLKALPPNAMNSPELVGRFQREVVALGNLQHRNIVAALDARQSQGIHYLIMEFIEGTDLWRLVQKRGPLPISEVVNIARQSCEGLAYAHDHNVVHRDIKPQNLILATDGLVKILDMGLARLLESDDQRLTQTGFMLGTVAFMAPEQARSSKDVTHSADVYSLGCTLYYLLAGQAPYGLEHNAETILAHRRNPIPVIRDVRKDCPPLLDDLVRKMMGKEPADRFHSLSEAIPLLDRCLTGSGERLAIPDPAPAEGSSLDSGERSRTEKAAPTNSSMSLLRNGMPPPPASRRSPRSWKWYAVGVGVMLAVMALILWLGGGGK